MADLKGTGKEVTKSGIGSVLLGAAFLMATSSICLLYTSDAADE